MDKLKRILKLAGLIDHGIKVTLIYANDELSVVFYQHIEVLIV